MKSISEVISLFPHQVMSRYDFSRAEYHGALKPITGIICSTHGEFSQYSAQLRKDGAGCPKCGSDSRAEKRRLDPDEFIRRASEVHPGRFTYGSTKYINMTTKVVVTCPSHGDFSISPIKLVHEAQGCPVCANSTRGHRIDVAAGAAKSAKSKRESYKSKFEERARLVHGDLYDYSEHGYTSGRGKVSIICKKHGKFDQAVYHHLDGQGCPRCGQKSAAARIGGCG